ncbi:MAG TPA: PP2C family protein-serine/threonine phosphatase [Ilumatobacteraceae bacterium]|nr:PP2C family protein-serine/threonine phosphatase [Ilumatobacteraceae bacterium]
MILTVVDLVTGALTRSRLHDHEQVVLRSFQESLFTPPPIVPGLDIAAGYRPAIEAVGMGGDWYSIVDTPDAVYAVIGDIAGHGPGAVAVMAEAKTIMRHLLTNGSTIEDTLQHADRALTRRGVYASAAVVRIDKATGLLRYANAGHPPALLFHRDDAGASTVTALATVHRPWLGVGVALPTATTGDCSQQVSEHRLGAGDVLLLYTDGLVEERRETLETSIRQQLYALDVDRPAAVIVDHLLTNRQTHRTPRSVDDDVAVVVIARTGDTAVTEPVHRPQP